MTGLHVGPCTAAGRERGAVMPIVLVAFCSDGAWSLAHFTKVLARLERTRTDVHAARAQAIADGELEFADAVAARTDPPAGAAPQAVVVDAGPRTG